VKRFTVPLILTSLLAVVFATAALAEPKVMVADRSHSEIGFNIRHFFNKVHGRFNDYTLKLMLDPKNLAASSVEVVIRDSSIDTGNPHRDEDLRGDDFFQTAKFPNVTFKSTKVIPGADSAHFQVAGDFTIRDVTKPVTLDVELLGMGMIGGGGRPPHLEAGYLATTKIKRQDYGILWNRTFDQGGVMLGDDVEIVLNIAAREKPTGPPPGAPATPPPAASKK